MYSTVLEFRQPSPENDVASPSHGYCMHQKPQLRRSTGLPKWSRAGIPDDSGLFLSLLSQLPVLTTAPKDACTRRVCADIAFTGPINRPLCLTVSPNNHFS
jgi:hypothetical protein